MDTNTRTYRNFSIFSVQKTWQPRMKVTLRGSQHTVLPMISAFGLPILLLVSIHCVKVQICMLAEQLLSAPCTISWLISSSTIMARNLFLALMLPVDVRFSACGCQIMAFPLIFISAHCRPDSAEVLCEVLKVYQKTSIVEGSKCCVLHICCMCQ